MKKFLSGRFKWIKRIVFVCILTGILGIAMILMTNWYITSSVEDKILTAEKVKAQPTVDCIMVLGAGVYDNKTPSPMLKDRLERAIELYHAGISDRILMTGDHGRENYDEVNVMKQYAIDAGVPSEHIFMDHAGFSTYESMYRAKDVFEVKSLVIITQRYHMYRALYAAENLGMNAYGVPAADIRYRNYYLLETRELLARFKDFCWLIVKPSPTYLGEKIPISGNGNETAG